MVDNDPDDFRRKLKALSKREAQVLVLRCGGMTYAAIGKALSIAVPTVKTDIGRVYMKLGLDRLEPSVRLKVLYDTICPLLKAQKPAEEAAGTRPEDVIDGEVVPEEVERPVPQPVMDMVEHDGKEIVPWQPAPLLAPLPRRSRRPIWPVVLVFGVVLGICLGGGAVYFLPQYLRGPVSPVPQPTPTPESPTSIPANAAVPSALPEIPTQTPQIVIVTATPLPATETVTSLPVPVISLPFVDDFDQGPRTEWQPVAGSWRMVDGTYCADEADHRWSYTMIGDSAWQDYAVQVDIMVRCVAGWPLSILVRSKNPGEGVEFTANCCEMKWIVHTNGDAKEVAIRDDGLPYYCGGSTWTTSTLKLEVSGNTYSAYLDSVLVLRMQDSTYSYGRAGLGTQYSPEVVRFDNLRISALTP